MAVEREKRRASQYGREREDVGEDVGEKGERESERERGCGCERGVRGVRAGEGAKGQKSKVRRGR
jgi:hypothetical protein